MLEQIRKFLSTPSPLKVIRKSTTADQDSGLQDNLFVNPKNLTFPGVVVAAGMLTNAISSDSGSTRFWATLVIAVLFGSFITWIAVTDPDSVASSNKRQFKISIGVGVINTALLAVSIYGVASI